MPESAVVSFAPLLYIPSGINEIDFYQKAFGARENMCRRNEDGSIHVIEFSIGKNIFHLHEQKQSAGLYHPDHIKGTTVLIGVFVDNVAGLMQQALAAGGIEVSPVTDYEYGYRQAEFKDPFGHHWVLQQKI